jgi:hypothetical protein
MTSGREYCVSRVPLWTLLVWPLREGSRTPRTPEKGQRMEKGTSRGVLSRLVPRGSRAPADPGGRARRVAALAAGIGLLAAACTGQQASQTGQGGGAKRAGGSFAHAPKGFPLNAFMTNTAERQTVDRAISVLVNSCMKEFDLKWPEYEPPPGTIPENARKYGVTDLESVRVYGYKPPLPDGVSKQQAIAYRDSYEARKKAITPAAEAAYSGIGASAKLPPGVPKGGCYGEAARETSVDRLNEDMMTVQKLFFQASAATRKDARIAELNRQWSACMRRSGMSYPDPLAAVDDSKWRTAKTPKDGPSPYFPAPSKEEIRTAIADVKCKDETDYIKKRSQVEFRYQRALIKKNAKMLAAVQARKQRMMKHFTLLVEGEKRG